MRKIIVKLAIKTTSRINLSIIFLCVIGQLLIFYSIGEYVSLQVSNKEPLQITAIASNTINLNDIKDINGISKISPVINTTGTLFFKNSELSAEIYGVDSSYFHTNEIIGNIFPNTSNMPYLLLNTIAYSQLKNEENSDTIFSNTANCKLRLNNDLTAVICGIVDDKADSPKIYMSYYTAKSLLGTKNEQKIWLQLTSIGKSDNVINSLNKLGLSVNFDQNRVDSWNRLVFQSALTALSGFSLIFCMLLICAKDYVVEQFSHSEENLTLLSSGLSQNDLLYIFIGRISILTFSCFVLSSIIAWWMSWLNFFSFIFTLLLSTISPFSLTKISRQSQLN